MARSLGRSSTWLFAHGDREATSRAWDEAVALAERLGDQERVGRVEAIRTNGFSAAGDQRAALESGHRAVAIAETIVRHRVKRPLSQR